MFSLIFLGDRALALREAGMLRSRSRKRRETRVAIKKQPNATMAKHDHHHCYQHSSYRHRRDCHRNNGLGYFSFTVQCFSFSIMFCFFLVLCCAHMARKAANLCILEVLGFWELHFQMWLGRLPSSPRLGGAVSSIPAVSATRRRAGHTTHR